MQRTSELEDYIKVLTMQHKKKGKKKTIDNIKKKIKEMSLIEGGSRIY